MAAEAFLVGVPLWLDVGLHWRGRGAPPGDTRNKCGHLFGLLSKENKGAAIRWSLLVLEASKTYPRMFRLVCTQTVLTLDHAIWSVTDPFHLPIYHGRLPISTFVR